MKVIIEFKNGKNTTISGLDFKQAKKICKQYNSSWGKSVLIDTGNQFTVVNKSEVVRMYNECEFGSD